MCVCSLCCWGREGYGPLWSVAVFLICASFPCVFLSQDSVRVARVLFWWGWVGLCVKCVFGVWEDGEVEFDSWWLCRVCGLRE